MRTIHALIAVSFLLTQVPNSASAQATQESVMMQVRMNFVPSTTRCALEPFVAAGPAAQPGTGGTVCAFGGPFGAGLVGVVEPSPIKIAGLTVHAQRTFTFNNGGAALNIRTVFNRTDEVRGGAGGLNYFTGTWEITGGTGAFANLRGQGKLTVASISETHAPPPPDYGREELVGWVKGGEDPLSFRTPAE